MAIPPATDERGHSGILATRVNPLIITQVDIVIKNRGNEYINRAEFVRESIYLNLTRVQNKNIEERSVTGVLRTVGDFLIEERANRKQGNRILRQLEREASAHLKRGALQQALRVVLLTLARLSNLPDGYWRDVLIREIGESYSGLLSNSVGIGLNRED